MKDEKTLIANFMGCKVSDLQYETPYYLNEQQLDEICDKIEDVLFENLGDLGYSDSCLYSEDKETKYIAIVEFIQWYNQNK